MDTSKPRRNCSNANRKLRESCERDHHLLLNSSKISTWHGFKAEIVNYGRAAAAVLSAAQITPMCVGALAKCGDDS